MSTKLTKDAKEAKPKNPGGIYLWYRKTEVDKLREKKPELEFK